MFLVQSVATFFSQVMAAIGGNTAGPGLLIFSVHYIYFTGVFIFNITCFVQEMLS